MLSLHGFSRALGEIALIVIGVLVALAIDATYSDLVEREKEELVLSQIATALRGDLEQVKRNVVDLSGSEADMKSLLSAIDGDLELPESRSPKWRSVILWRGIRFRSGPYEELKDHGFDLIEDPELRKKIIDLYEYYLPSVVSVAENDRKYSMEMVVPYFMQAFRHTEDWSWDVGDTSELQSDQYFINLMLGKLQRLQNFLLPRYEQASESMEEVVAEVEMYLARGR